MFEKVHCHPLRIHGDWTHNYLGMESPVVLNRRRWQWIPSGDHIKQTTQSGRNMAVDHKICIDKEVPQKLVFSLGEFFGERRGELVSWVCQPQQFRRRQAA